MRKLTTLLILALASLPALSADVNTSPGIHTEKFKVLLSSSHEVPPLVGTFAMADAVVEMLVHRDGSGMIDMAVVDFRVNYHFGQEETMTNMHIHRAPEGQNGGVVVPSNFGPAMAAGAGNGSFFRHNVVTEPSGLGVVEAILANPGGYYLNIHTASNPGGIMRGQLMPFDAAEDAVEALAPTLDMVAADAARINALQTQLDRLEVMVQNLSRNFGLRIPGQ